MQFDDLHPRVVLGIAAHPDDLDCNAGGTMAYFAQQGADVYYLTLTDGGCGSGDRSMTREKLMNIRQEEQRNAGKPLGLKDVFFCTYPDGCLENTKDVRRDIVKIIRTIKPDVVIAWDPSMFYCAQYGLVNHPDHRASGQAALDAVFPLARDHMSFPELLKDGYEPHKTSTVLLMNFNDDNYFVDISDYLDAKNQSIAAHTSQMPDAPKICSMFTALAEANGSRYGVRYAETFVRVDIA